LLVGNRADDQGRPQFEDFINRIHVPTIAKFWEAVYRGNFGAPFRNTH
jgi:hypothetical protein